MNKILRYSFIALLALVCHVSFAQTYLWQEDFSSYKANDVPSGGTYNYVCVDCGSSTTKIFNEKIAGGTAPELLIAKKKDEKVGSFSATIPLNGKSGEMTLAFKANKNVNVTLEGATVGTIAKIGNDYSCPITVTAGTEITITIASATTNNTRIDDIKLFQGEAKKPAGLSWGTASRTVTIGAEDNSFPTLTNANKLPITYTSSETSVATISSEGVITLVAAGKTNITASFTGNDEYEAGKVSYELTVKEQETVNPTPVTKTCANIADFKKLESGTTAILTLTNAQVVYKNVYTSSSKTNTEYYVRDATGAIMFYNTGLELEANQILNGTVEVKYTLHKDMPEATKSTNTSADNLTIAAGSDATPTKVTVADLTDYKYLCDLVTVENANIVKEEANGHTNYYLEENDEKVMIYDKFKTGATITTGEGFTVTGILVTAVLSGTTTIELAPISDPIATGINEVVADDAHVNAPAYNLAGRKVAKSYKGVVIKAGKKLIQK